MSQSYANTHTHTHTHTGYTHHPDPACVELQLSAQRCPTAAQEPRAVSAITGPHRRTFMARVNTDDEKANRASGGGNSAK